MEKLGPKFTITYKDRTFDAELVETKNGQRQWNIYEGTRWKAFVLGADYVLSAIEQMVQNSEDPWN